MTRLIWFLLALTLVTTGCASREPTASPSPSPLDSPLSPPSRAVSPLATPTSVPAPETIPSPQAGLGAVTGRLVGPQTGQTVESTGPVLLYLTPLLYSTDGTSTMAKLDKNSAPMSLPDETGRFVFPDVEPGEYALAFSTVTSEFLLRAPASDEDLVITVAADQVVDVGELYVEAP